MIPIYPVNFPNIDQNANTEVIFQSISNDETYGQQWKRTGYCSRCGDCCDDDQNIFATHDGNYEPNPLVQVVPGKCAYFRWGPDGLSQCVGRDTKYYNQGCVYSPSKLEMITGTENFSGWPNCTYKFERIV